MDLITTHDPAARAAPQPLLRGLRAGPPIGAIWSVALIGCVAIAAGAAAAARLEMGWLWAQAIPAMAGATLVTLAVAAHLWVRRLARALGAGPGELGAWAQGLSCGQLRSDGAPAEPGTVLAQLQEAHAFQLRNANDMRASIDRLVQAHELARDTSEALAQRSRAQAAAADSLVAGTMNITAAVKHNTDDARAARTSAKAANAAALDGGRSVSDMVRTMSEIEKSSSRVAQIIQLIEGIAFQTNLLALNAAVEAARAGDAGRGFAVVAGEVRNLAQRSAQSAGDIKKLIVESSQRVSSGAALAEQAGATIDDVVKRVGLTSELIASISENSHKQSSGVEEINVGLNDLAAQAQAFIDDAENAKQVSAAMAAALEALCDSINAYTLPGQTAYDVEPLRRLLAEQRASDNAAGGAGARTAAGSSRTLKMRFSHSDPPGSSRDNAAQLFAQKVREYTGGRVEVSVFHSAQLGNDAKSLEAVAKGEVDFAVTAPGNYAPYNKALDLTMLPFLVDGFEHGWRLFDESAWLKQQFEAMHSRGVHVLGTWEAGFRCLSSTAAVNTPADARGLKIRIYANEMLQQVMEAIGFEPAVVPLGEVYDAIASGRVNGQDNPLDTTFTQRFHEVAPYITMTRHIYSPLPVAIAQKSWDKLAGADQDALVRAARDAALLSRKEVQASEATLLQQLQAQGAKVNQRPDLAAFRQATEVVYSKARSQFGANVDQLLADAKAARR